MTSVTLQQFQFFQAVARNLSFSAAAKELYTSQPYVSNQIRKIEDHYGISLFIRSQPKVALTDAGRLLHERVSQIMADVAQLEQVAGQLRGERQGTVTLAATASAGNHLIPELIASFNRLWPEVVVQGRIGNTREVLAWVELGEVEVGVCPQKPVNGDLTAAPFYREPLVVICPAGMDLPLPLPLPRLAELPKVVREEGSLTRTRMCQLLARYPSGTEFVAQLAGTTAVNEAVAAGLGVSLVPAYSATPWLKAGTVRECPLEAAPMHHDFYLIYSRQRCLAPAAQALAEHLRGSWAGQRDPAAAAAG